jgi:hypothetical protein
MLEYFSTWGRLVMQWIKDRDRLIEETLEFAKSVAMRGPARIETPRQVEPPKAVELVYIAKPKDKLFEREEIRQRVADFKATQSKFQHEREEYYKATMAKVRSGSTEKVT